MIQHRLVAVPAAIAAVLVLHLSTPVSAGVQDANSTVLDSEGNARITRFVPLPHTVSPEARTLLATGASWCQNPGTPEHAKLVAQALQLYPVVVTDSTIAGVHVRVVRPAHPDTARRGELLINLHGGGFVVDSGTMLESVPMAALIGITVMSVDYRLAPQYVFPAAIDDVVAVWRALLEVRAPDSMVLFGTSAGAVLAAQSVVQFRCLGLATPAAVGFFTGWADFSRTGDTWSLFGVPGLAEAAPTDLSQDPLLGGWDPADPLVSPVHADLAGFPPTLCIAGTRDCLLSDTASFHRALLRAGVDARLVVFDALPHAFWYTVDVPESREALGYMRAFFIEHLGR